MYFRIPLFVRKRTYVLVEPCLELGNGGGLFQVWLKNGKKRYFIYSLELLVICFGESGKLGRMTLWLKGAGDILGMNGKWTIACFSLLVGSHL